MSLASDAIVIGVTGAFGSGCSTATQTLYRQQGFHIVKMSDIIRQDPRLGDEPSRQKLQAMGNRIREEEGPAALVRRALRTLDREVRARRRIAFDGIRNSGEVAALRDTFGYRFSLLGVLSDGATRWDRMRGDYLALGLDEAGFLEDDERDRGQEGESGQQVAKCVDLADAIVVNGHDTTLEIYEQKILAICDLLTQSSLRPPTRDEIHMNIAFTSSHLSQCLKRHVGAVVIDSDGEQTASGYNENPPSTLPCRLEPKYDYRCHRDRVRNRRFRELGERGVRCPTCHSPLEVQPGPPWRCAVCLRDRVYTDLEPLFFPDRAMSWCTAIHAEDRALRTAGVRATGSTLYTTTFPCFQCADKIILAGVRDVVFVEAYPDPLSAERLDLAGVVVRQFEGVLSPAFGRVFANARPE